MSTFTDWLASSSGSECNRMWSTILEASCKKIISYLWSSRPINVIYHDSFVFLFFLLVRNTSHCQGKYRLLDKTSAENIQVLAVILRSVCFIKNKHVVSFGETARGPEVLVATYKRDCAPIPFIDYGRRVAWKFPSYVCTLTPMQRTAAILYSGNCLL